jgi:hypothetical protein
VWASFASGPYTGNPDSGEQFYDQGGLAIVKGDVPLLANTPGLILKNKIAGQDDTNVWSRLYDDNYGGTKDRTIYNIFYPATKGQDAYAPSLDNLNDAPKTRLTYFEDTGAYTVFRGTNIEDMYGPKSAPRVDLWNRSVVYVRPDIFAIFDETKTTNQAPDQHLSFHLGYTTTQKTTSGGGKRFEVNRNGKYIGSMTPLYPENNSTKLTNLFDVDKVYQVQISPPNSNKDQNWLTVFDVSDSSSGTSASKLPVNGGAMGALVVNKGLSYGIVFVPNPYSNSDIKLSYTIPALKSVQLIYGLKPGNYDISAKVESGKQVISVSNGGSYQASESGVLYFGLDNTTVTPNPSSDFVSNPNPTTPTPTPVPAPVPAPTPIPTPQTPAPIPTPLPNEADKLVKLYRLRNKYNGAEFFTRYEAEAKSLLRNPRWQDTKVNLWVLPPGNCEKNTSSAITMFYRSIEQKTLYTRSAVEKAQISKIPYWTYRLDAFCSAPKNLEKNVSVYRFRNLRTGVYRYAVGQSERTALSKNKAWKDEGVVFVGMMK